MDMQKPLLDSNENNLYENIKPPIKKRNKVEHVIKDTKEWTKEHPIIAVIAFGLSFGLVSQVALSCAMMVNSTLWHLLDELNIQEQLREGLHSVNVALSKFVGLGFFEFTESGSYVLNGKEEALKLYSSVGAKLTTATVGLGIIGSDIANKINNKKRQKENELKEYNIEEISSSKSR